jgi:predicted nucleic acid-binding protein
LALIFIDSTIPMYLVGAAHANNAEARRLLEACIHREERLVTDAEVLQEILHRYAAIERRDAIQPAFDAVLGVIDEVFPVELEDVERAKTVLLRNERLSARDALHVAVMERRRVTSILTFDAAFDQVPGLRRVA